MAETLSRTKRMIAEIKEQRDKELAPLEVVKEKLTEQLIKNIERVEEVRKSKSVETSDGKYFYIYPVYSFKFPDEQKELDWAKANGHVLPDRKEMKKHLEASYRKGELPAEVEPLERMALGTRGKKEDLETNQ